VHVSLADTETGGEADDKDEKDNQDGESAADETALDADDRGVFLSGHGWKLVMCSLFCGGFMQLVVCCRRLLCWGLIRGHLGEAERGWWELLWQINLEPEVNRRK